MIVIAQFRCFKNLLSTEMVFPNQKNVTQNTRYSTLGKSGSRSREDTTTPPGFSIVMASIEES